MYKKHLSSNFSKIVENCPKNTLKHFSMKLKAIDDIL